jgi:glycosyltransferase involved in cell wall biosynthesis
MRIALVAGTYQPDRCGVAHYTACLRSHLQVHAVQSIVLTTQAAAEAAADPTVKGVVQKWGLGDLPALVQAIQIAQPDLLHVQHAAGTYGFDRAIFLLPLLLRLRGWHQPIVTTVHEYGWWEWQPQRIPPRLLEWLKQWGQARGWWDREDGFLLTQSDAILTTNAEAETVIRLRLPGRADRVTRLSIAANVQVAPCSRAAARQWLCQQTGWTAKALVITFFGFLHPVKGLETLLAAFAQVQKQHPQARLLLVGGVESLALRGEAAAAYWHKIRARSTELEFQDSVYLTGYQPAEIASRYLTSADIGVLPFNHGVTLKSGSLLTLLAHRLPVIATDANPPDPDLTAARVVQSIPVRDVSALTGVLQALIAQPERRSHLSQTGYQFVQQFSWESIAQNHFKIYSLLLGERAIVEKSNRFNLRSLFSK